MRIDSYEKFLTQFDLYEAPINQLYIRTINEWGNFAEEIGEPNEENWWLWREFLRTMALTYTPITRVMPEFNNVLDANPHLKHHFIHVAASNPMLVAYTEDEDKGLRDIQTITKLGRYLTRFAPGFNASYLSNQYLLQQCPPKLKFAFSREEIHRVYANGPHSCMVNTYRYDSEDNKVYAVEVYAGPDTAVAYLGDYKIPSGVTARTVVNQKDRRWIRCYGNAQVLETLLEQAGYRHGSLEGCRVLRITDSDYNPIMPYLDGVQYASNYDHNYLLITEDGEYLCNKTDGTCVEKDEFCCTDCDDTYSDEDDGSHLDHGWVCQSCLDNNYIYAYTGRHGQEYVNRYDESVYEYNGDYYTVDGLNANNLVVLSNGDVYSQEDVVEDYLCNEDYIPSDDAVAVADADGDGMTRLKNISPSSYNLSFDLTNEVVHLDRDYDDILSEELTTLEELIALYPEAGEYWWVHANNHVPLSYRFRKVIRHLLNAVLANQFRTAQVCNLVYLSAINEPTYAQAA